MEEVFFKRNWIEENVVFFIHFVNGKAVRQIEVSDTGTLCLSINEPAKNGSCLYDQDLNLIEGLQAEDFITAEEFEREWHRCQ